MVQDVFAPLTLFGIHAQQDAREIVPMKPIQTQSEQIVRILQHVTAEKITFGIHQQ